MNRKILFITHQLSRTGAPIVLLDMIKICLKHGAVVDVITLLDGELRSELEALHITITIKDDFFKDREAFSQFAGGYDAVVANTLLCYQVIYALNGTNIPVIWWLHEGEQYFEYFKTVLPDFQKLAPNIQTYAVGHYVQDVVKHRYGCTIPILHFGIRDQSDIRPGTGTAWEAWDPGHHKIRFFTAGTYSQVKAQDSLCAAISSLSTDIKEQCCFLFCGNEENVDEQVFHAVSSLCESDDCAHKLPGQPHETTMQLMRQCDFVLIPSRIDPIPTVAVEAMTLSKPCLITDVCGVAHYLKNDQNALLFTPDHTDELCLQIEHALSLIHTPDNYEKLCRESRKVYDEHFSFDQFEPQVIQLLQLLPPRPRLVFMTGAGDRTDHYTHQLSKAFQTLGYDTLSFDTRDMEASLGKLAAFISEPVKAVITFNSLGVHMELVPGKNMWDELGIQCIDILMDDTMDEKKALTDHIWQAKALELHEDLLSQL